MSACEKCGNCCTHMVLPVVTANDGYYDWLEYHGGQLVFSHNRMCVRLEIPCRKLVAGRCSIYPERPQMCRKAQCERQKP